MSSQKYKDEIEKLTKQLKDAENEHELTKGVIQSLELTNESLKVTNESSAHHRAASFRNGSVAWLPPRRVLLRWQQQRLFGREKQVAQLQQEPGVRQGLH